MDSPYSDLSTTAPSALPASLWRNRGLVLQLVRRDISSRYRGSWLGLAWSVLNPVLMLLVYSFVFSVVFKARWGGPVEDGHAAFGLVLFAGLIVHALFSEVANRAPRLILDNVSYVKRVVFPLEVLPWVALGSALFHMGISLVVLLAGQWLLTQSLPWTALLLPVVVAPLLLVTLGCGWFLAATGVYLRDIGQSIGLLTTVMLFLSPTFYPLSALPELGQTLLYLNPLTLVIEESRRVLLFGQLPHWGGLLVYSVISVMVAWGGFWWFQRARRGFADVV
ncbi:ABC transporter permease [Marichromatium gracile]|uniref:Transport permease protein n=1 Tax=Marichromatium gracile TaxID=1048 RepID=A0A4R4AJV9_MARGR|nr:MULTISPECIES: ABC transporter permease [Marichromatium]MBO8087637.1 ABC transporter permease [Marichromatium sp.]MBK1709918.1 sugar ABC transporter permease [Marichromatium gracile]MCF1184870.1 ABC transporter permease [Marichromatium gracile]RNE92200.1 ABC transporter permease [Marichromatium sp. AB31]RNE92748.1 ABC transporter permease [Marichromatium sp. AB32]